MKVHSAIVEQKPDLVKSIKGNAKSVGLDQVDYEKMYTLVKLGAKTESLFETAKLLT